MNKLVDATSTPLSSIFGSGFLVIVPILAGVLPDVWARRIRPSLLLPPELDVRRAPVRLAQSLVFATNRETPE